MRIAVLGAGMVGRTIALDLAKNFDTTSFDIDPASLIELERKEKEGCEQEIEKQARQDREKLQRTGKMIQNQ